MAKALQLLLLILARIRATAGKELLKGISYGPAPLKGAGKLPNDDFMAPSAKAQWSSSGRGDLEIMKKVGANAVRLYGNDPREDHKPFLDEAAKQGLEVIPGMSDYPYTQMPKNCMTTDFNCYSQIKEQYKSNLQNGFADKDGSYHPALKTVIVINEPDLKIPGISQPSKFCRAIISAIDGMIDAEKEVGVKSNFVNFTATFSFGICTACEGSRKPALGQMIHLHLAMTQPEEVGYKAQNDLAEVYRTRFTNSFNTNNPATDMKPLFLNDYEEHFKSTPVFIGEYHSTHVSTKKDIEEVMDVVKNSSLVGISFFEFQVRYDKGGSEMDFGMFGLGQQKITTMDFFGVEFPVWCLMKMQDKKSPGETVVDGLASAFQGAGISDEELCVIDPEKVPLSEDGYQSIRSLKKIDKMAAFVSRVVQHLGGVVSDQKQLQDFAQKYMTTEAKVYVRRLSQLDASFTSMVSELSQHPSWVDWDANAACIADRASDEGSIGEAVGYVCGELTSFNCTDLPSFCSEDLWMKADYVLSLFYLRQVTSGQPLRDCNFNGAAMFAPSKVYRGHDTVCIVTKDPSTTALSEEGYQTTLEEHDAEKVAIFVQREVEDLKMQVTNSSALKSFAEKPPAHFKDLKDQLSQMPWVCGGPSGRNCPSPINPSGGGASALEIGLIICIILLVVAVLAAMYVRRKRQMAAARNQEVSTPQLELRVT